MSHESDRSGAGVVIAVAVALVFVILGCLVVAGAGVFLLRSSAIKQQQAIVVREEVRARRALTEAQALQQRAGIVGGAKATVSSELTIALDAEGNLQLNGVATDLEQLRQGLQEREQNATVGAIHIQAAADSKFEDVSEVLALCMETGVVDIQIRRDR